MWPGICAKACWQPFPGHQTCSVSSTALRPTGSTLCACCSICERRSTSQMAKPKELDPKPCGYTGRMPTVLGICIDVVHHHFWLLLGQSHMSLDQGHLSGLYGTRTSRIRLWHKHNVILASPCEEIATDATVSRHSARRTRTPRRPSHCGMAPEQRRQRNLNSAAEPCSTAGVDTTCIKGSHSALGKAEHVYEEGNVGNHDFLEATRLGPKVEWKWNLYCNIPHSMQKSITASAAALKATPMCLLPEVPVLCSSLAAFSSSSTA